MKSLLLILFNVILIQHLILAQENQVPDKIYIQTDKPVYKPGETLWFSAFLLGGSTHTIQESSDIVYVDVISPKGDLVESLTLVCVDGQGAGDYHFSSSMSGGIYTLKAYTKWMQNFGEACVYEKKIQVQAIVKPRLLSKLDFHKKGYGAGAEVQATLDLKDLKDRSIAYRNLTYTVKVNDGVVNTGSVKTNREGRALLSFSLPNELTTDDIFLSIQIPHEGTIEGLLCKVPILNTNEIDLQFLPEGGHWAEGIRTRMGFKAIDTKGEPVYVKGEIVNEEGQHICDFESFHDGMGAFEIKPAQEPYFALITEPKLEIDRIALPEVEQKAFILNVFPLDQGTKVRINAPYATKVVLNAKMGGEEVDQFCYSLKEGNNEFSLDFSGFPMGILTLGLHLQEQKMILAERSLFINKASQLAINITSSKEKYLPHEKVELLVETSDQNGGNIAAFLSLAVVNDKVLSLADDRSADLISTMFLTSELKGDIHEPNFYFEPKEEKADQALDYLMMTQAWTKYANAWATKWDAQKKLKKEKSIVKGRLLDYRTEKLYKHTRLYIPELDREVKTDKDGIFVIENIDLSSPKYIRLADSLKTPLPTTGFLRFYTDRAYTGKYLKGKVIDQDTGKPIEHAYVNESYIGHKYGEKGTYELPLFDDLEGVKLTISAQNYNSITVSLDRIDDLSKIQVHALKKIPKRQQSELIELPIVEEIPDIFSIVAEHDVDAVPEEEEQTFILYDQVFLPTSQPDEADLAIEYQESVESFMDVSEDEEVVDDIFEIVEAVAAPEGGMSNFLGSISKSISYPYAAKMMEIEGKVYVQFVVSKSGKLEDIKVVRGIGVGCDEEAIRAISNSTVKWKPATQRGRKVRQRIIIPINFKLASSPKESEYKDKRMPYLELINSRKSIFGQAGLLYKAREFYVPKYKKKALKRTDFRETIYWNPRLKTNDQGVAKVEFPTSSEITSFQVLAQGHNGYGLLGKGETHIYTEAPLAISYKSPAYMVDGDIMNLPLIIQNNGDQDLEVFLKDSLSSNLTKKFEMPQKVFIKSGETQTVTLAFEAKYDGQFGQLDLQIKGGSFEDQQSQTFKILPRGYLTQLSISGKHKLQEYHFDLGKDVVPNSIRAYVKAYPDMVGTLMHGIGELIREPYGCFEQTSAITYPNLLVLSFLQDRNDIALTVKKRARDLIEKGYQRLIGFEVDGRGFDWFGKGPANMRLSALGLMEFTDMKEVYPDVDSDMIERTRSFLLSQRDGKGGYTKGYGYYGQNTAFAEAYITLALVSTGQKDLALEIDKVYENAITSKDNYLKALAWNVLMYANDARAKEIENQVFFRARKMGWESINGKESVFGCYLEYQNTEIVAYMLQAMMLNKYTDHKLLSDGINYLLSMRSPYGFGSTTATVQVLKTLVQYQKRNPEPAQLGDFEFTVNGNESELLRKTGLNNILQSTNFGGLLASVDNKIGIAYSSDAIPYHIAVDYHTYRPVSSKNCPVSFKLNLEKELVRLGETVLLNVELKNEKNEAQPMTMVKIGIPSGLSLQTWQLKEMQEQSLFDFYEIKDHYLFLYFIEMNKKETKQLSFALKSEFVGDFNGPANAAYLYYNASEKQWEKGLDIKVVPNDLKGDVN
ncbi:TonB family protein [Sediminitomix flava]|uniref:TonB family protein n=1 Tax=Sediminitomix flava TaxID=379075 RepID=A0A315ZBF0_SEDFL|nr:TonB family protein [Sediminitomix flava]PWJ42690.1 TonB family protein [Sediminitomix flava]